jgi:signal transduction histidine kinase
VRAASALAYAIDQAAQEEDRAVLSLGPGRTAGEVARAGEYVDEIARDIAGLALAPRAAEIWALFQENRTALVATRDDVVAAAARGDARALGRELSRWRLMTVRSDALLKDFVGYHLRLLDRTMAELQVRRVQALRTTIAGGLVGLLVAAALALAFGRAVVRPIVGVARAAERIADTGRPSEVAGADRDDEIGTLARSFNRMTEQLFGANARLAEADRAKDDFLAMLSHELRNPLAPLRTSLYLLDRVDPASPAVARAHEVMRRQVAHLARLVDDLLDGTRIARGKIELRVGPLDLGELARRCAEDHAVLMRDRALAFAVEMPPPGALWVDGDETRLAQVIGNLLHNAAKFTPAGGRVELVVRAGDAAEIRVRDTGVGIPPQLLPHVFEPFTQAKQGLARSDGGLGLGLALVKGIVELHGGTVSAGSDGAGRGADVVVRLPKVPARDPAGATGSPG